MENEIEFISRGGGQARGKEWDAFLERQRETLAARASAGWQLVAAVGVQSAESMREASKTSGVLLYFSRP